MAQVSDQDIRYCNYIGRWKSILKKIGLLLFFVFSIVCLTVPAYAEAEKSILIKTIDNTEAIEEFKEKLIGDIDMLSEYGVGNTAQIGTPFSEELQGAGGTTYRKYDDGKNVYWFYFPIINNGKIIGFVKQAAYKSGEVTWNISDSDFGGGKNLEQLGDGEVYAIITDKNFDNDFAVSDSKTVILRHRDDTDSPADYNTPYEGVETKTVNILEPIDISSVKFQNDDENAIFENARANGKTVRVETTEAFGAINKNDRLLIPLRNIAEIIDCTVEWDGSEKAAYVSKNGSTAKFVIGSTEYTVDNEVGTLDVPAEIFDDKTYIPFRAAGEALGIEIAYNPKSRKITFSY